MIESTISLVSIVSGLIGANLFGWIFPKYSLGLTGNSMAGVFGSILFIKSLGRFGFGPVAIMESGSPDIFLLAINLLISILGGIVLVLLIGKMKKRLQQKF